ncbi:hypothetical protein CBS9595_001675 [Malassezia furfur]|nr:hypothetical protein CBS9595_001675 [Malassezia furfur]
MAADAYDPSGSTRLSRASKDVMFGSVAGMMSKIIEHPFDLIKVRLQTQPETPHYTGAYDCCRQILRTEGVRGLFRGVSMPLVGATLENAALFLTYNQIQALLRAAYGTPSDAEPSVSQLVLSGAGAGAVAACVLTPVELIKCKMQVQTMAKRHTATLLPAQGALSFIAKTVRESGVRGLWLGFSGTLLRETGGSMAWFTAFELSTRELLRLHGKHHRADLSSVELAACGALAGISYNVSLFPADSVKSMMQTERELQMQHATTHKPTGFFRTLDKIYRTRGIRGLYAGLGVTCLRSAPSSALVFLVYNKLEQAAEHYGW